MSSAGLASERAAACGEAASRQFAEALAWQARGDLDRADAICEQLLREQPSHADAWHLRGLLAFEKERLERGIELIGHSLRLNPLQPAAHANVGGALLQLQRASEALEHFDRALELQPDATAATLYGRGSALLQLARFTEALAQFDRALHLAPQLVPTLIGRAQAMQSLEQPEAALSALDEALRLAPQAADAHYHRGDALFALHRHDEALASYDRALAGGLKSVELLNNRGNALRELSRHSQALSSYQQALALAPERPETLTNHGNALLDLGRLGEALGCYEAALSAQPDFAAALDNQGLALLMAERPVEAARSYERLSRVAPDFPMVASQLLNARLMCCEWSHYGEDRVREHDQVVQGRLSHPFPFMAVAGDPHAQLECARRFTADRWSGSATPVWQGERYHHERLRIAYVSADFREHAVAFLLAGVLERHDRERFETIGIALRPEERSVMGERLRAACGKLISVTGHSDLEAARLLRDLEVDIAVDLMGYTRWSRPGIFAHRGAPVQASWLGYAGTMGAGFIDYLIADAVVIPAGEERYFSESVVRLPYCYLPNDDQREIAPAPTREAAGLPASGAVLCAFTNAYKINPPVFAVWMRLLRKIEGSVLWLRGMGEVARGNLERHAEQHGVERSRLVFAPHVAGMAEHLGRQSLADLYLDTQPYNAHSTACDALWAGVPVLTCAGRSFASRVAASVLTAVGLPELITQTLEEYECKALELLREREKLAELRARLARGRLTSPLFDTAGHARHLERAYLAMHERAALGAPPVALSVAPDDTRLAIRAAPR